MFVNHCSLLLSNIDNIINQSKTQEERDKLIKMKSYIVALMYMNNNIQTQNICKSLITK